MEVLLSEVHHAERDEYTAELPFFQALYRQLALPSKP
jgi:hypothetical protein